MPGTQSSVEERLEQLLQAEEFPPPPEFAARGQGARPGGVRAGRGRPAGLVGGRRRGSGWTGRRRSRSVLDDSNPPFYTWFADGTLNASYNCLDRHVEAGHGDRVAFHWRGEEGEERDLTYAELLADVQRLANGLKARGVGKGDVVGIYLPMIPEVVVAMLACARIGAPHNVIFGGFAPGRGAGAARGVGRQGADHRRRRPAQGQDGRRQGRRRRGASPACRRSRPSWSSGRPGRSAR